jgi:hypothetical protein
MNVKNEKNAERLSIHFDIENIFIEKIPKI